MKINWWMYNNTSFEQFTMISPKHCWPVFQEVLKRGHELRFNHVPRPPSGEGIRVRDWADPGPLADRWLPEGRVVHDAMLKIVKETGDYDPQNRAQRRLLEYLKTVGHPGCDVQYVELYPMVSMLAKIEAAQVIMRCVLHGVPVVVVDQDYSAPVLVNMLQDLLKMGPWAEGMKATFRDLVYLWTPYCRRLYAHRQWLALPSYNPAAERPINGLELIEHQFAYVGNDYMREEFLEQFYRVKVFDGATTVSNAIWGRWDTGKVYKHAPGLFDAIPKELFHGPVPPSQIHDRYRTAWASIAIAHRQFVGPKLIAFRWFEVPEAGRLLFADRRLQNGLGLLPGDRFVDTPEEALDVLERLSEQAYFDAVLEHRLTLRKNPYLKPEWTVDALEAIADGADYPHLTPMEEHRTVYEI